jgi:hypothetical protein
MRSNELGNKYGIPVTGERTIPACDEADLQDIITSLNLSTADSSMSNVRLTSNVHDVRSAVSRLKSRKSGGGSNLSSDHILHGADDCLVQVASHFKPFVVHCVMAASFSEIHDHTNADRTRR